MAAIASTITRVCQAVRKTAPPEAHCFACGRDNPHGLKIPFTIIKDGSAFAEWTPNECLQSFQDVIHGGVLTTAMDEAMAKAIVARGMQALTCELRVRMHESVRPGTSIIVRGWIVKQHRRLIKAEATICSPMGDEHAHAWASFLVLPGVIPTHGA